MLDDYRTWAFIADMNGDGAVTISDVWLWVKWLYFYPGDLIINLLLNEAPKFTEFFEISYKSYGGIFSFILSVLIWNILIAGIKSAYAPPANKTPL